MPEPRPPCPHCGKHPVQPGRRGLCWKCSNDPAVRARYPVSRQAPRPLTPAERRARLGEWRRRRRAGETYAAIAADYGVTGEAVRSALGGGRRPAAGKG